MPNPTLTIRISPELKQSLAVAAEEDNRSVTEFVCRALRLAIAMGPVAVTEYLVKSSKAGKRA